MEQTTSNEKIAMAMLMQCALVWEYCTKNDNAGRFSLGDVRRGVSGKTDQRLKSKPGMVFMDLEDVKWEGTFRMKLGQIEGVTLSHDNYIHLKQGGFSCGYWLRDVWEVAYRFCQNNIPYMGNKAEFGCDGDDRWARLPEIKERKEPKAKTKAKANKAKAVVKHAQPEPTLADRLCDALLRQLRQAA